MMRFLALFGLLMGLQITTVAQENGKFGKLVVKSAFLKKFCVKGKVIESADKITFEPEPTAYSFKRLVLNKQEILRSEKSRNGVWRIQTRQKMTYVFKSSSKS
jgi:hypothetical protein